MNVIKKIFGKISSPLFSKEELIDQSVCPNCWGRYDYDGQYKEFVNDHTKASVSAMPSGSLRLRRAALASSTKSPAHDPCKSIPGTKPTGDT
ncbi:MAG: hypothetical protein AAF598_19300, partial [Bacteroidota bacterium]